MEWEQKFLKNEREENSQRIKENRKLKIFKRMEDKWKN